MPLLLKTYSDDTFRMAMLEHLDGSLGSVRRDSVSGDEVAMHDEAEAECLVCLGMSALNLEEDDLIKKMTSGSTASVAPAMTRADATP